MILFVSASPRALECAHFLEQTIQKTTVLCASTKAALGFCRGGEFVIVVLDQATVDATPRDAAAMGRGAESVLAVYVNTALMSPQRIANEVRGALARLDQERTVALRQAEGTVRNEIRNEITGILLAAGLALSMHALPPQVAAKLRDIRGLADRMRHHTDPGKPLRTRASSKRQPRPQGSDS